MPDYAAAPEPHPEIDGNSTQWENIQLRGVLYHLCKTSMSLPVSHVDLHQYYLMVVWMFTIKGQFGA